MYDESYYHLCKHKCGDFQEKNEKNNEAKGLRGLRRSVNNWRLASLG